MAITQLDALFKNFADPTHPVRGTLLNCVRSCFGGIPSLDSERAAAAARVAARQRSACD